MATKKNKKLTTFSKLKLGDVFSFQPNGMCFVLIFANQSNDLYEYFNLEKVSSGLTLNRTFCNHDAIVYKKCSLVYKSLIPF